MHLRFIVLSLFCVFFSHSFCSDLYKDNSPRLKTDFSKEAHACFDHTQSIVDEECVQSCAQQLKMTWCSQEKNEFHWRKSGNGVLLEFVYYQPLPAQIAQQWGAKFHREVRFEKECRVCTVIDTLTEDELSLEDSSGYMLHEPRIFDDSSLVKHIDFDEFISLIGEENILFYTGAGLSAEHVPAMTDLKKLFFLEKEMNFDEWVAILLNKPSFLLKERIEYFFNKCFNAPPSKAHRALKEIIVKRGGVLFTENLDHLHEKSGILPLRIGTTHLKKEQSCRAVQNYRVLICFGLSHDDRGFIGWYKKHCPEGKIIAIDWGAPNYLGSEDFLLQGDLQTLIPQWLERM